MQKKILLLLWETCNRACPGCCNNDWDLDKLPVCEARNLHGANEVILTGGEPMLFPLLLHEAIRWMRLNAPTANVYVYTAKVDDLKMALTVGAAADGMTVTLHDQSDVEPFVEFARATANMKRSWRLNVFKGVTLPSIPGVWVVKGDITWLPECPLPPGEVFMRMKW